VSRTLLTTAVVALVIGLMTAAAAVQRVRETRYPAAPAMADSLYITSGEAVARLTRGYNALAADLYWIRAIQYYGGEKLRLADQRAAGDITPPDGRQEYALLYPLLDLTTSLDPAFNIAYRFGSIFLAEAYPGGAGRPDLAIALLAKGLRARPDKWEYMQDIGFVHYWWRQDYQAAGDWFNRAAEVPGAPWWLRSLAATTLAEGGDRRSSRLMWESIYQSAEIEWLRRDAERRLLQLQALDDIDGLQQRVDRYTAAAGTPPSDWVPLVRAGLLRGAPVDPSGSPYEIDAGRVRLSRGSALFPLPTEPKRQALPVS
jgi:hypothetical protein